jgi:hypothetical protein
MGLFVGGNFQGGRATGEELGNPANWADLGLTPEEVAAIVAFLKILSDGYVPWFHWARPRS